MASLHFPETVQRRKPAADLCPGEVVWLGGRLGCVEQVSGFMGAHDVVVRRPSGNCACFHVRGLVDVFKLRA